ncbi:MAG: ornithine carbamoyltransferase [Omnitrophica WOR_2 bacterium GWC2_45_7]|nr:MAG: ornithine carbamoyltransferase [Omnitrophica WOR_2 bacterium GWA2_45_18]OGX20713.1 MAG: ornithine carbamoyltransferase [Omnitrophica WOR_2 bacterium GWC2_45_7]
MKRDLISLQDLTRQEISNLLDLTEELKTHKELSHDRLKGKTIALVFQKPSNRTRVSFEVGIAQLGGHCIYLGPEEINLGVRESTADVSKTLSRYLDGIVARTHTHQDIIDLTRHATIPIINGLSDLCHPCQALTDIFSIKEKFGRLEGLTVAYVGDGNNVCHSLMLACTKMGVHINVATPPLYEPKQEMIQIAQSYGQESGAKVLITHSPQEAVQKTNVIYSDTWVSMGQEEETHNRLIAFNDYQVNAELVKLAMSDYIFMHCLPAHRGQEVTDEIIDGGHSIVFDQAENRLHTQKAILIFLLGNTHS